MSRSSTQRSPRASGAASTRKRAPKSGAASQPRWLVWLRRVALGTVALVLLGAGALMVTLWYYGRDLPSIDVLRNYEPPQTTRVVDRNGEVLGEIFTERRTIVPMERIPRVMVLSTLAAEDADFYQHEGLDYPGLMRSVLRAIATGSSPKGTSTITQQLVKLLLLSPERTLTRKIKELILARRIEQELTKDEILHLYLSHINYGHGRYGVEEAARFYFAKDAEELTLAEASLLAGLPQSPSRLSPRAHPEAARRRQLFVLEQLEAKRDERWPDVAIEDIRAAHDAPIVLAPAPEANANAPEVLTIARQMLLDLVGEEAFARGGYTVHTTIDLELEEAARSALRSHLEALDERHRYRGPLEPPRRRRNRRPPPSVNELVVGRSYQAVVTGADDENGEVLLDVGGRPARASIPPRYNPEGLAPSAFALEGARVHVSLVAPADEDGGEDADKTASAEVALELGPEGAVVVIDPRSRDVLALVGGYGAVAGFDRATRALRQPGSTFKPIVYALGIRSRRYTPASIVIDAPAVYDEWRPENFEEWNYAGQIRLRDAVAKSVNVVAVRVIEDVSPAEVVGFARQLGIRSELEPTLGLALGSSAVLPIELVNAYATFAAFGRYEEPRLVTRIEGPNGRDVPLPAREPPRDVLTPAEAYLVTSLLTSVVTDGTARAALALERPAAGKTGTSNEARDAWFVGYTPSTVAGVWVGFDDNRSLGRRESGGRAALPVWMDVIRTAERGRPPVDFPVPSGVVTVAIDPESGLLPWEGMESPLSEVFLEGTEPTETARPPDVADSSTFLMEQMGGPEPSEPSTGETSPGVPPPAPPPPATP